MGPTPAQATKAQPHTHAHAEELIHLIEAHTKEHGNNIIKAVTNITKTEPHSYIFISHASRNTQEYLHYTPPQVHSAGKSSSSILSM